MTRNEFLVKAIKSFTKCTETLKRKNEDYASDIDALKNFRKRGVMGIITRMEDKISRVEELASSGRQAAVAESVEDTLLDLANYAVIAAIVWNEQVTDDGDDAQTSFDFDGEGVA